MTNNFVQLATKILQKWKIKNFNPKLIFRLGWSFDRKLFVLETLDPSVGPGTLSKVAPNSTALRRSYFDKSGKEVLTARIHPVSVENIPDSLIRPSVRSAVKIEGDSISYLYSLTSFTLLLLDPSSWEPLRELRRQFFVPCTTLVYRNRNDAEIYYP